VIFFLVRWMLLLAAVHRCSGGVILIAIVLGIVVEYLRERWLAEHPPPWSQ
jgi:hypothetical protein